MNDQRGRRRNGKDIRVAEMLLGCLFLSAHSISSISPATMVAESRRRNSKFDENNPYEIPDQGNRKVEYAAKKDIMDGIVKKYRPDLLEPPASQEENGASGGQEQQMTEKNEPSSARQQDKEKRRGGGAALQTAPRNRRSGQPVTMQEQEVKSDGQA